MMKKMYLVSWTHIYGGSNVEKVHATSAENAIKAIEMRQGASNLTRCVVLK